MQDFTGSTKRAYLLTTIRHNLDQMDDIELAIVLAWLKSGDLYKWGAELLTKNGSAQDVINHAEGVAKAAEAAELAKKAEEDARRAAENQPRKTFFSSPLAAISGVAVRPVPMAHTGS